MTRVITVERVEACVSTRLTRYGMRPAHTESVVKNIKELFSLVRTSWSISRIRKVAWFYARKPLVVKRFARRGFAWALATGSLQYCFCRKSRPFSLVCSGARQQYWYPLQSLLCGSFCFVFVRLFGCIVRLFWYQGHKILMSTDTLNRNISIWLSPLSEQLLFPDSKMAGAKSLKRFDSNVRVSS